MSVAYVTGATGCIGRNLVDVLLGNGWKVIVLHRGSSDLTRLNGCDVECREAILTDLDSTKHALRTQADALFHCAGNVSHDDSDADQQWRDNVLVTDTLLRAVRRTASVRRFIFTSTAAVAPIEHLQDYELESVESVYVRTKRLAEILVQESLDIDTVIIRPVVVIGRYDWSNYTKIFKQLSSSWIRVSLPGSMIFTDARSVARAHLAAYYNGAPKAIYSLGGEYRTWHEFYTLACKLMGLCEPWRMPMWLAMLVAHLSVAWARLTGSTPLLTPQLLRMICRTPKHETDVWKAAERDLGYMRIPLEASLRESYEWWRTRC